MSFPPQVERGEDALAQFGQGVGGGVVLGHFFEDTLRQKFRQIGQPGIGVGAFLVAILDQMAGQIDQSAEGFPDFGGRRIVNDLPFMVGGMKAIDRPELSGDR